MECMKPSLFSLPFTYLNKEIIEDKFPTPVSTHPKNIYPLKIIIQKKGLLKFPVLGTGGLILSSDNCTSNENA